MESGWGMSRDELRRRLEPYMPSQPPDEEAAEQADRRAYLILLWKAQTLSSDEEEFVVADQRRQLGCPTRLLNTIQVKEEMPTEPDAFVVATALHACKEAGIEYESSRDTISFARAGTPDAPTGLITIIVNSPA